MYTEEQIDAIGLMLEEKGLSHSQIDEYFEHHGVIGMKWGFRKGKDKTGVNRIVGAKIDINNRRMYRTKNRMNGTGYAASAALGRAFLGGKERQLRMQKTKIKELTAYNKRLKTGKMTVKDKLGTYGQITINSILLPLAFGPFAPAIPMRGPSVIGAFVQRTPKPLVTPPRKKK